MFGLNYGHEPYRVIGIDPGTSLGVAYLEIDLAQRRCAVIEANTLPGDRLARQYPLVAEMHGDRTARLVAFEESLLNYFRIVQPHSVICESPFMRRKMPMAFASLTETVSYVRRAVLRYDPFRPLHLVDPPTAKMAVGMKIKKGQDKDDVKRAVMALTTIENPYQIPLADLDEHSIDAIAVGYTRVLNILNQM